MEPPHRAFTIAGIDVSGACETIVFDRIAAPLGVVDCILI
jgi:hypothetical protein